jgi:hypothetical protein
MCLKHSKKFAPLLGVCLKHIKQPNHDQKKLKALFTNFMYTNQKKKKKKLEMLLQNLLYTIKQVK